MQKQPWILLAEDREDDVLLIQKAFSHAGINNPIYVVRDGDQVMSYLMGNGKYCNRAEYPLPDLLLLDLKMPGKDGFEVLEWIRQDAGLATLRVLVLTSSEQIRDVTRAYRLGANSFLVKPLDFQDLMQLSRTIQEFWLQTSKTPESHRSPPAQQKRMRGESEEQSPENKSSAK